MNALSHLNSSLRHKSEEREEIGEGGCFENWIFGNWILIVIWKLEFGI